ncbi:MAG: hypothetical protein IJZ13_00185 [Clostridia bacterium]|nr:hypothetical protein [Clostridia bacterium]
MKKFWIAGGCVLVVAILCLTVFLRNAQLTYNPDSLETFFDENNVILETELALVSPGMTYGQVIHRIGKANEVAGSGFFILGYACTNGKQASLTFTVDESNPQDPWVLEAIHVE